MARLASFLLVVFLTACAPCAALAQSASATLSGSIIDESGAVVADVTVTLLSVETRTERRATTARQGLFTFPALPPGRYVLRAERSGFAPAEVDDVALNVGDQLALTVQLHVGTMGESVTVNAEAGRIRTSPAVATTIDRQFVENLPLNGRSFQSLIALTPGAVIVAASSSEPGQFSVNGQRSNANYFTVDGVSANIGVSMDIARGAAFEGSIPGWNASGGTNSLVSVDALEEFKIQTSTFAPEFGRSPGAQVSIVTRSGTNALHGSAFNYLRNDVFDANDWFANANNLPKAPLRQNNFGGVAGGPLLRNALFFFVSYEGLRLRLPQTRLSLVPSLSARAAATPAMQPVLNAFPLPNGEDLGTGLARFNTTYSDPTSTDATSIRIDRRTTGKLSFFGRYNHAPSSVTQRSAGSYALNSYFSTALTTDTATAGATWIASDRVVNEARVNYSRNVMQSRPGMDTLGGGVPLSLASMIPSGADPNDASLALFINGGTLTGYFVGKNVDNTQAQLNLLDTLSVLRGRHQLKFGVDYRDLRPESSPRNYSQTVTFPSITSAIQGIASSVSVARYPLVRLRFWNLSLFAQDTWQASERLNLTYGVRWDHNPPPVSRTGPWLAAIQGLDDPATFAPAPEGTTPYRASYANFAPRVGAVYALDDAGRTQIRGGVGLFYDLGAGRAAGESVMVAPSKALTNVALPLTDEQATPPATIVPPYTGYSGYVAYDPDLSLPYTVQWNVALERQLGSRQAVSITYVGASGRDLLRRDLYIRPNPLFTNVSIVRSDAWSDYHALQVQFERRLSRGLQVLASYTLGSAKDTSSNDAASIFHDPRLRLEDEYGPSTFDVRHAFSLATTYELPAAAHGMGAALTRGWALDFVVRAQSAAPVNVTVTRDFGTGLIGVRPDRADGVPLYLNDPASPGGRRINPDAFVVPAELRQGSLSRNALRGFDLMQADVALHRDLGTIAGMRPQLRVEVFNITNHPNFGLPSGALASGTFGVATAMLNRSLGTGGVTGGFSPLYQVGGPRSVQLSVKVQF